MARRNRLRVTLDDRTSAMSDAALTCRADGHTWARVFDPATVVEQRIRKEGVVEKRWVCSTCTAEKTVLRNARNGVKVARPSIRYTDDTYLIKDGSGRMAREEAALADFARTYATVY